MLTFKKLAEIINREFGPPFLHKNEVIAKVGTYKGEPTFDLTIGRVDMEVNSKGQVISHSTLVNKPDKLPRKNPRWPKTGKA